MPLEAALQLAALAGADSVAEVKRDAREWLQSPEGARRPKAGDAIAYIERLIE